MTFPVRGEIVRAPLFHTPRNPFLEAAALEAFSDGALFIQQGKILDCGDYTALQAAHPDATVTDLRGGFLLPGLIDTHIHFPQLRVLGGLGKELLTWLEEFALPEEARMAELSYACETAHRFVRALVSHGTTTALVFGAHFGGATAALFQAGLQSGLRIVSGMVLSDRLLRPELRQTHEHAYRDCTDLIARFHRQARLLYAVTPRFALSSSEAMLEVCTTLMREHEGLRFQTHLNENRREVEEVARLFPWAQDYLGVYDRFGLTGRGAVMAHNVHCSDAELERLAGSGTAVSHCPCSNAALGSGFFPLRRHIQAGVQCSLGTDVGAGTGFGILKEGLQAYLLQRLAPEGFTLDPEHLLYLATRGGAEALNLGDEIGDFTPGKAADFVYLRPPKNSTLAAVIERADDLQRVLAALFTLGDATCVREVRVAGSKVYCAGSDDD
ncbi:MAG: guanine deaminase [Bryobacterales bacterium]|nr:guanine deaminase [Bryobacterales bacterium]MBV9401333.1 guanine deaminase [Bryobacterales bacterium]